ncbi:MAG TPA: HAMP domain-containing sensor histidine kinase [Anaerolineales bacterium]|nr:HAMP domain-containing sensor histidine kinase [Anaerolineales bacterium]
MLKRLRLQLTLLYLLAALGLVVLIGFGSYSLVKFYFERETDQALQYKMAEQFRSYNLPLPAELVEAEQLWLAINGRPAVLPTATQPRPLIVQESEHEGHDDDEEDGQGIVAPASSQSQNEEVDEDSYDGQLASIFTLPLDANGNLISAANPALLSFYRSEEASRAALLNGKDLRTVSHAGGSRVRLLTYRTNSPQGPVLLQLGRVLTDQDRVLNQFLLGLLTLGAASGVVLGMGSWWLSGRSLGPAQKAWDQQQAFVSNASHELRTPLTLIKASTEVGLRSHPDDEVKELLQDILDESDYMNSMVNDLLLLSRLDTQRLTFSREYVSLPEMLTDTARQVEVLAGKKGINLRLGNLGGGVHGDRDRIRQVLLILLDNAMRFTPAGGTIHLETSQRGRWCQIIVRDNGSGIPAEHLPHIFERFYQASTSDQGLVRSNGLGLSIAKGIIEAQGGTIRIESQAGKGTRAILELPSAGQSRAS